jgi:hypothetical protein
VYSRPKFGCRVSVRGLKMRFGLIIRLGKKGRHPIHPKSPPRASGPLPSPPLDPEVRRRGSSKGRAQGAAAAGARVPLLLRVPRRRRSQVLRRAGGPHRHEQGLVCSRRGGGEDQGEEVLRTPSRWEPEAGNRTPPPPSLHAPLKHLRPPTSRPPHSDREPSADSA